MVRLKELALQAANGTVAPARPRRRSRWRSRSSATRSSGSPTRRTARTTSFSGQRTRTPAYAAARGRLRGRRQPAQRPDRARRAPLADQRHRGRRVRARRSRRSWQLQAELTAGTPPSGATLTALDAGLDAVLAARAQIGSVVNRLDSTRTFVESSQYAATKLLSDLEDADMAEVISQAAQRQAVYEAALSVNARILRRSLVDEL